MAKRALTQQQVTEGRCVQSGHFFLKELARVGMDSFAGRLSEGMCKQECLPL